MSTETTAASSAASAIEADPMWHRAYMDVQAILDRALGTEEEDGAGAGIAADVALLASQRDRARREAARLKERLEELTGPGLFPLDEFRTLQGAAAHLGAVASKPCRCEPGTPCGAHGGPSGGAVPLDGPVVTAAVPGSVGTGRDPSAAPGKAQPRSEAPPSGPSDPREALGRVVHETRCTFGATLDRPFLPAPWEERHPRQQELDMQIGVAVAAAERERAGRAESTLAALRTALLEGGQDNATARRRALAILGGEGEDRG